MKDFYHELDQITPVERDRLVQLARQAAGRGMNKIDLIEYRDAAQKLPILIMMALRAPQGQWICTLARPSSNAYGWVTLSVNIEYADLNPPRGRVA